MLYPEDKSISKYQSHGNRREEEEKKKKRREMFDEIKKRLLSKGKPDDSAFHYHPSEEHFETESEAWLVYPLKASGEKGIEYNDAVEEVLCFEWIDSILKRLDDAHQIQGFCKKSLGVE